MEVLEDDYDSGDDGAEIYEDEEFEDVEDLRNVQPWSIDHRGADHRFTGT